MQAASDCQVPLVQVWRAAEPDSGAQRLAPLVQAHVPVESTHTGLSPEHAVLLTQAPLVQTCGVLPWQRTSLFARALADFTSRCHDEGLLIDPGVNLENDVKQWLESLKPGDRPPALPVLDLAASLPLLLQRQYAANVVTYGDLLTLAIRLLRDQADEREEV